ncbi:hypothetical protein FRB94_013526 [Tulasnella sp. JGI-2019a]|nr:hypothetical protein FRB93_005127 [Tulasnella sp. JGI-2019a]KAG9014216.1 hypothetical protein FRB94_013526 [Tulasnella sp. JGI-2019a]KAG9035938.1 hypothetical protein FRB95_010146 [Tulasnella sp. JGI-2019a]
MTFVDTRSSELAVIVGRESFLLTRPVIKDGCDVATTEWMALAYTRYKDEPHTVATQHLVYSVDVERNAHTDTAYQPACLRPRSLSNQSNVANRSSCACIAFMPNPSC